MSVSRPTPRYAIALVALLMAGAAALYIRTGHDAQAHAAGAPPAADVDVARVVSRSIIDWQEFSGRLQAVDQVDIRPQVGGKIVAVHFRDASLVKRGDVLFTIDPRPYQAEVDRAQADVAAGQARAAYTSSELARAQRLIADNAIAKRDFDEKQIAAREATAALASAKARWESARLNLEYTRITAPVDGRVSRAEITVGNVVAPGLAGPPLTTLVSVQSLYASFNIDEQTFLKYVNPARAAGTPVPVALGLANETGYSREGTVSSVDNRLDLSSSTIRVRAEFPNADGLLVPGLYARIRLGGGAARPAILIDDKAIGTDQDKRFVLVVDDQNKTSYREVKLGAAQDGLRIVDGLAPTDRIVVNGMQRVRSGDTVAPREVPMQAPAPATVSHADPAPAAAA